MNELLMDHFALFWVLGFLGFLFVVCCASIYLPVIEYSTEPVRSPDTQKLSVREYEKLNQVRYAQGGRK